MWSRRHPSDGVSRGSVVVAVGKALTSKVYGAVDFSCSTVGSVTGKVARLCLLAVVTVSVNTPGLESVARALAGVEWVRKSIDHEVKLWQEVGLVSKPDPAPVPCIETSPQPPLPAPATCDITEQAENTVPNPIALDSSKLATTTTSPLLARAQKTQIATLTPPATPLVTQNTATENYSVEGTKEESAENETCGADGDASGDVSLSANGSEGREEGSSPSPSIGVFGEGGRGDIGCGEAEGEAEDRAQAEEVKAPPPPVQPHGSPSLARKGSVLAKINETREMAKLTEKLPGSRSRRLSKRVAARKEIADGSDMFDFEEDYENDSVMSASSMASAKSAFF